MGAEGPARFRAPATAAAEGASPRLVDGRRRLVGLLRSSLAFAYPAAGSRRMLFFLRRARGCRWPARGAAGPDAGFSTYGLVLFLGGWLAS